MIISHIPAPRLPIIDSTPPRDAFRSGFYRSLIRRADVLFELTDAVNCGTAPVTDLARLSLEVEHRRGHGGLYDAHNAGRINSTSLRAVIAEAPVLKIVMPETAFGLCWLWMSLIGCVQMLLPAQTGRFVIPTREDGAKLK